MASNATDASYARAPSPTYDSLLLSFYLLNILIGVPGNILSLSYFLTQPSDIPMTLYRLTSSTDICILVSTIPTCLSLIYTREPVLFSSSGFCTISGMLQTILPAFSVGIVAVLCVTRTVQLLQIVRKPSRAVVLTILFSYLTYLILGEALPVLFSVLSFFYTPTEMYCWDGQSSNSSFNWGHLDIIADCVSFTLPVLPITLCCVISTTKICLSLKFTANIEHINSMKRRATVTILIFTAAYIVFNIPIFVVQVLRVWLFVLDQDYPGSYFSNYFMYQYGWNVSKMFLTSTNAAVNPLIYLCRMHKFRDWFVRGRIVGYLSHLSVMAHGEDNHCGAEGGMVNSASVVTVLADHKNTFCSRV